MGDPGRVIAMVAIASVSVFTALTSGFVALLALRQSAHGRVMGCSARRRPYFCHRLIGRRLAFLFTEDTLCQ